MRSRHLQMSEKRLIRGYPVAAIVNPQFSKGSELTFNSVPNSTRGRKFFSQSANLQLNRVGFRHLGNMRRVGVVKGNEFAMITAAQAPGSSYSGLADFPGGFATMAKSSRLTYFAIL